MLKDFIKKKTEDPLIKGSMTLICGSMILYVCSYLYHFYSGRMLGPEDYGIVGALFSLLYVLLVPFNAIQMGITKFVSEFNAKKEFGKIKFLLNKSFKKFFLYGIIITIIFILFSGIISNFLKIPSKIPVIILGLIILPSLLLPIFRGTLQGLQSFIKLGANLGTEGFGRIFFVILLISLGFGVNGAILALVLAFTSALIIMIVQISKNFNKYKEQKIDTKELYKYSWPVFFITMTFTLIFSLDIILVKHFFDSVSAGYYTALSNLGKIVFFLSFPIIQVMFPVSSEETVLKKNNNIILKSFLMIFTIGGFVSLFYFLFPQFMISILYGSAYMTISSLLGPFSIFMLVFSLSYLIAFYNLSKNRTKFVKWVVLSVFLEILLIWLFHSSLIQVILSLISLNSIVLLYLLLYTKLSKK